MILRAPAAFLFAALLSGAATAAEPQVYRLTPAERDAAIAAADEHADFAVGFVVAHAFVAIQAVAQDAVARGIGEQRAAR